MRRLSSLLPTPLYFPLCVTLYTTARFLVISGKTPAIFPDSIGYETLTFWGPNDRFWAVPLVYSIIDTTANRVLAQSIIGALAWIFLAYVLQAHSRYPRLIISLVFIVGLAPQVVRYDIAILAESLGISFTVAAVAAAIQLSRNHTMFSWIVFLVAASCAAFTRPTHLFILFVTATCLTLRYFAKRRKTPVLPVIIFCLASLWGVNQLQGNTPTSNLNFYTILQQRIIRSDSEYKWFVQQGMPDIPGVRDSRAYTYDYLLDDNVANIVKLPTGQQPPMIIANGGVSLAEWVRDHGWTTYFKFLQTHPTHVAKAINRLVPPTLSPGKELFLPLHARTVMPRAVFGPWWMWIGLLTGSLTWSFLFSRQRKETLVISLMAGTGAIVFLTVILCSAVEIQRHASSVAVLLRVLAIAALALVTQKRPTARDESADAIA